MIIGGRFPRRDGCGDFPLTLRSVLHRVRESEFHVRKFARLDTSLLAFVFCHVSSEKMLLAPFPTWLSGERRDW